MHDIPPWIYVTVTSVTAIGVLLQAAFLGGMLFALKKALKRLDAVSQMAEEHIVPAMGVARKILEENAPKVKIVVDHAVQVSADLAELSRTAKEKSAEVGVAVDDLVKRTEVQAERLDEMLTGTLDSVSHATATLQRVVTGPVRHIGAVLNGLRAGFDVLVGRDHDAHTAADGDQFI
jgi:methyl-accepting chemotaxis protein